MKSSLLQSLFIVLIVGCNYSHENKPLIYENDDSSFSNSIILKEEKLENSDDLPNSLHIIDSGFTNLEIENNLKNQLDQYQKALLSGDTDIAYKFLYPGVFNYIKGKYPAENIDEEFVKVNVLMQTFNMITRIKEEKNIEFEFKIKEIKCRQSHKGTLILVINTALEFNNEGEQQSYPSNTICISEDFGLHWNFLSIDENMTETILTNNFNEGISKKIINCN